MKRHALFFACTFALAAAGTVGLAAAQSTSPASGAPSATTDGERAAGGERMKHHGRRHGGERHAIGSGIARMDTDDDGRVSRVEFEAARAARAEAFAARKAARDQVRAAADEASGRTAGAEAHVQHAKLAKRHAGPRAGSAWHAAFDFDAIDANGDGYIVRTEAVAHRDRLREQMRAKAGERMAAAFAAADLNGDGRLGRVEVEEKMPRLSGRFAWMDDNRDGFLDRAEFEEQTRR